MTPINLQIIVIVPLLSSGLFAYNPDCKYNRKGDSWCARRISIMKTQIGYNALDPAAPFIGNKCTTNAGDNGMFRWEMCCRACKEYLGGLQQAKKDHSYMHTSVGFVCTDSTAASTLCKGRQPGDAVCSGSLGRIWCLNTCGYCNPSTEQRLLSTLAPCTPLETCMNHTMCKMSGSRGGSGQCTSDGSVPVVDTVYANGGKCVCDECARHFGKSCETDAGCGNLPHHCVALEGKCDCGSCTRGSACLSDSQCGGTFGTCGYISLGIATADNKGFFMACDSTGFGDDGEMCACQWCPGEFPCRNIGADCTTANAVQLCGHATFCVGPPGATKCACRLPSVTPTVYYDPGSLAPNAAGVVQVCIDRTSCGINGDLGKCGHPNVAACRSLDGTSPCTAVYDKADPKCKCVCSYAVVKEPNFCLGASTGANREQLPCQLGSTTECGTAVVLSPGNMAYDVCLPDMETGVCMCGSHVYPQYTQFSGLPCLTYRDCQSSTDKSAICAAFANPPVAVCAELVDASLCVCTAATAVLVGPGLPCTSGSDDQCGWGKCVSKDSTAKCQPGAVDCVCAPAGCANGRACGLEISVDTCGGVEEGCRGKCYCP